MDLNQLYLPNSTKETTSEYKEDQPDTTAENENEMLSMEEFTEQLNTEDRAFKAIVKQSLASLKLEVDNLHKRFTVQQLLLEKCLAKINSQGSDDANPNIQDAPASDNDEYLYGLNEVD